VALFTMRLNRVEDVIVKNGDKEFVIKAKVDTGADRTSIDQGLINELGLELLSETKTFKSANGVNVRPLVKLSYLLKDKLIETKASVSDRSRMSYQMIIGCNDLKGCSVMV